MMRMPGTRAGLNERSQSAYAMPRPTPVDNETGHARPAINQSLVSHARRWEGGRTFEEYDRENYAYAEAQTAVQERVSKLLAQGSNRANALTIWSATIRVRVKHVSYESCTDMCDPRQRSNWRKTSE